jgi:AcrR family transcriptional regulator
MGRKQADDTKRRRLSAEARRQQMVDAGGRLLVEEPLENLTVQRIADAVGVSRGLVFHYFPTVRDLQLACLEAAANDLVSQIVAAIEPFEDPDDKTRAGLDAFIAYIGQQPLTYLTMSGYSATDPDFGQLFESVRQQMIDLLVTNLGFDADNLTYTLMRGWVALVEASVIEWLRLEESGERLELNAILVEVRQDIISRCEKRQLQLVEAPPA